MAITSVDICNRALIAVGSRNIISALTQDSVEARVCNLVYNSVQDWCLSLANWNFARKTTTLTVSKSIVGVVSTWSPTTQPAPPWKYEYSLPTDFIRALYLTNSDHATLQAFDGEPQRFVMASIMTGLSEVLLTNATPAILNYTFRVADPTLWPMYFERLVVSALAWNICSAINGNAGQQQYFDELTTRLFMIAEQNNREEGLTFGDTTPEWIQAVGIPYPYRRQDRRFTPDLPSPQPERKR